MTIKGEGEKRKYKQKQSASTRKTKRVNYRIGTDHKSENEKVVKGCPTTTHAPQSGNEPIKKGAGGAPFQGLGVIRPNSLKNIAFQMLKLKGSSSSV